MFKIASEDKSRLQLDTYSIKRSLEMHTIFTTSREKIGFLSSEFALLHEFVFQIVADYFIYRYMQKEYPKIYLEQIRKNHNIMKNSLIAIFDDLELPESYI